MFSSFKVVNGLVLLIMVFVVLQVSTVSIILPALSHDKDNFHNIKDIGDKRTELTIVWTNLLRARLQSNLAHIVNVYTSENGITAEEKKLSEAQIASSQKHLDTAALAWSVYESMPHDEDRLFQDIKRSYTDYHKALTELLGYIENGDIDAAFSQPTQQIQSEFEAAYVNIIKNIEAINQSAVIESDSSYDRVRGLTLTVLVLLLIVAGIAWMGIRSLLLSPLNKIIRSIRHIASGDLRRHIDVRSSNEMGQLADSLRDMQEELARTVGTIRTSADALLVGAGEISAGNINLSSRTEQQAASLEQTAASMEQLTATVKQNADNAGRASELAKNVSTTAQRSGTAVNDVVSIITNIADSAGKIRNITSVIDGIAFQTNILALNAAVEAARAGEQGRGFAVVAGEVRVLAQRSADAAKEIRVLIEDSTGKVSRGSELAKEAGSTMNELVGSVTDVTILINQISSASDEQSRGIEQVRIAVTEIDQVTQKNAVLVEESSEYSASLENLADELIRAVAVFNVEREISNQEPLN